MDINEICSYRVDCFGCPRENDCSFLKKKVEKKTNKTTKKYKTIKELCHSYPVCEQCPFNKACTEMLGDFSDDRNNEDITKSIIETAKLLQEENKYDD